MKTAYSFEKSCVDEILDIVRMHALSLSCPMDSFMEDRLFESEITKIIYNGNIIGYTGVTWEKLYFFYVVPCYYSLAPAIFEDFVTVRGIKKLHVMTNDPLFISILAEWNYEILERGACFFTDAGRLPKPDIKADAPVFRQASSADTEAILLHTGDFFDNLEARIADKTIFVLEDEKNSLLGCGIIEKGRILGEYASIGMITCKEHRQKGVARTILWHLKECAYQNAFKPIAGCWYYNTLSRKSLEASGMIPAGKGFDALLIEKEKPPVRTGNPPGELV